MADLSLTSEQELLRNAARDVAARECPLPEIRRIDDEEGGFSRALWDTMAALGWPGILVSTDHGGEGASLTDAAVLFEELGRGLVPSPLLSTLMCALLIERAGSDAQRDSLLPAIARGECIVALAFTEEPYGWTPDRIATPAAQRNGAFVLNDAKHFVPDAGVADTLLVAARNGEGLTLLVIDRETAGIDAQPIAAWSGQTLYDISFRDVRVPPDGVLGETGRAWDALEPALDIATALLCAYIAGASRRVYEISLAYAQQREQFGQPIARFQRVQDLLIEILNHADAARWTAYEAVWKLENGRPDAREAVSVAKLIASEGFYQLCDAAHHVHGGIGSEKGYGLYLYTKASRSLYHYLGDPAHHRRRLGALLGLS